MKKRGFKLFLLGILLLVLLRGPLFRWCIRYECTSTQEIYRLQDEVLLAQLREEIAKTSARDIWNWAEFAQRFTARHLRFVTNPESSQPEQVWSNGKAHCVGYAALMGAVLEEVYRLKHDEILLSPKVTHCRGEIYLLGWRLTGPNRLAFFRDHDFIYVSSSVYSDAEAYDPAIYDYLRIKRVRAQ
ncbi:MAG: hypothetical protein AAFO03_00030 [Bacteroidota bacterium]